MPQTEKTEKLLAWFARAAVRHAEAMESMRAEEAARQAERLDAYFAVLNREGGLERFLALLDNSDPAVSGMAAVYAMRRAPQRSTEVLSTVANVPGLLGFRAKSALELWESGAWPR